MIATAVSSGGNFPPAASVEKSLMRGVEPGREERTRHEEREAEGEAREQKRKRSRAEQSGAKRESRELK